MDNTKHHILPDVGTILTKYFHDTLYLMVIYYSDGIISNFTLVSSKGYYTPPYLMVIYYSDGIISNFTLVWSKGYYTPPCLKAKGCISGTSESLNIT